MGAAITKEHGEKVLGYIERAKRDGAKVECGGDRIMLEGRTTTVFFLLLYKHFLYKHQVLFNCLGDLSGGHYVTPCVLTGLSDSSEAAREEIFGSVACVFPFQDEEEVVRRANDTPFGLGGTQEIQPDGTFKLTSVTNL